ncbi:MAG: hypothetical protein IKB41_05570 [Clostridia bacterium]|nr:hypothetical protein [Clostridia bacterium]
MNNDEKSRTVRHAKINILDVAIILLILLTVLAIWQKDNLADIFENDRTKSSFAVAFEVSAVRYDLVEDLAAGTVFYVETEDGFVELGMLLDEPVITWREGENGSEYAYVDLVGTLSCHGILREGALVVDSDLIVESGKPLFVMTQTSNLDIQVISITEIR